MNNDTDEILVKNEFKKAYEYEHMKIEGRYL